MPVDDFRILGWQSHAAFTRGLCKTTELLPQTDPNVIPNCILTLYAMAANSGFDTETLICKSDRSLIWHSICAVTGFTLTTSSQLTALKSGRTSRCRLPNRKSQPPPAIVKQAHVNRDCRTDLLQSSLLTLLQVKPCKASLPTFSEGNDFSYTDLDSPIVPGVIAANVSAVQLSADNPTNCIERLPSVLPFKIAVPNTVTVTNPTASQVRWQTINQCRKSIKPVAQRVIHACANLLGVLAFVVTGTITARAS